MERKKLKRLLASEGLRIKGTCDLFPLCQRLMKTYCMSCTNYLLLSTCAATAEIFGVCKIQTVKQICHYFGW